MPNAPDKATLEARELAAARTALLVRDARLGCLIGVAVHLLFLVTDIAEFPHDDIRLYLVRFAPALCFSILWPLSYRDWAIRHAFVLVLLGMTVSNLSLAWLILHRPAFLLVWDSGFVLLILGFCVFVPVSTLRATLVCAAMVLLCVVTVWVRQQGPPGQPATHLSILLSATAIALVGRHAANLLWEREFRARHQLQNTLEELSSTQNQLVQSEKISALGRLVAGVAHELNNSLSVIDSNLEPLGRASAELCNTDGGDRDEARETIGRSIALVRRGVQRAENIVQNLRPYSAPSRHEYVPANVNELLEMAVTLVELKGKEKDVHLHSEFGQIQPVLCDAQSMSQVFVNVLSNACDAAPCGGNVWIQTRQNRNLVVVKIMDDGPGVAPENLTKLFEPFFTTKPPGAGMGLGLSITRGIVEAHKGKIQILNANPGAEVSIELPVL